ncbi:MAG: DUF7178 family protein [Solirubrobacteraceae bacterium]
MNNLTPIYYNNPTRDADSQWYYSAHEQIAAAAAELGMDTDTFAGIVAALSPRQAWDTSTGRAPNLDAARALVTTGSAPTFKSCVAKALIALVTDHECREAKQLNAAVTRDLIALAERAGQEDTPAAEALTRVLDAWDEYLQIANPDEEF